MKKIPQFGFNLNVKCFPKTLQERFIVPPFSVLDARQQYWQKRKRAWVALGVKGSEGRGDKVATTTVCATDWMKRGTDEGGSTFDPVLCEVIYRWFCPPEGHILDPFAGGCPRGCVAVCLGMRYTGIELREEQVLANRKQAKSMNISPEWILGDSHSPVIHRNIHKSGKKFDLLFTCPPYYDLEIYSEKEKDGSAFETYEKFMAWYYDIFRQSVYHLKKNSFVVVVVGEIRNKKTGEYRNFVGDTISCFKSLGLKYYNEIILVTPTGSLPVRAGKQFNSSKKIAKGHQNILVFYKGDLSAIKEEFTEKL